MAIILRNDKGSALTHTEMDTNFRQFFYSASVAGQTITLYKSQSVSPGTDFVINTAFMKTGSVYSATSDIEITGSLNILGELSATSYNNVFVSSSTVFKSGSTKFGDSFDDSHDFTGSLNLTGSQVVKGGITLETAGTAITVNQGLIYLPEVSQSTSYSNDTAAASGGVPLGGVYRNGNILQIRLT